MINFFCLSLGNNKLGFFIFVLGLNLRAIVKNVKLLIDY